LPFFESELNPKSLEEEVTLFAGSFNPLHLGHIECIKMCPEKNIVLVLDRNPHKENRKVNYYEELKNILEQTRDQDIWIYPGFWIKDQLNPTAGWIGRLRFTTVNLLMGDDSFINLFKWKNPEDILGAVKKIYVVSRNHALQELEDVKSKCMHVNLNLEIIFLGGHKF
jgi:nicotinate-nucleotide adenylyltransferase